MHMTEKKSPKKKRLQLHEISLAFKGSFVFNVCVIPFIKQTLGEKRVQGI